MRRTMLPLGALGALVALGALPLAACSSDDPEPTDPNPPPQTATVTASATANVFSPSTQRIARGGTVTWTFGALPHNVTFGTATGAPANIGTTTNASASRQFNTAGSFPYSCTLHQGMNGTIEVQ